MTGSTLEDTSIDPPRIAGSSILCFHELMDTNMNTIEARIFVAAAVHEMRKRFLYSQAFVADEMRDRGFNWSPGIQSSVEGATRKLSLLEAAALCDIHKESQVRELLPDLPWKQSEWVHDGATNIQTVLDRERRNDEADHRVPF